MGLTKKRTAEQLQLPMAAMIDVVFQLLIYFIVTHVDEIPEAHLAVNLPSPNPAATQPQVKPKLLELTVMPDQVLLQGVPRSPEVIQDTLTHLAKLDPDQTVIVKVNTMARTEELVRVLDLCEGVGLSKLNVVTLK